MKPNYKDTKTENKTQTKYYSKKSLVSFKEKELMEKIFSIILNLYHLFLAVYEYPKVGHHITGEEADVFGVAPVLLWAEVGSGHGLSYNTWVFSVASQSYTS